MHPSALCVRRRWAMDEQRDLVAVGTGDGGGFPGNPADRWQPGEQRTEYGAETLFDTGDIGQLVLDGEDAETGGGACAWSNPNGASAATMRGSARESSRRSRSAAASAVEIPTVLDKSPPGYITTVLADGLMVNVWRGAALSTAGLRTVASGAGSPRPAIIGR